MLRSLIPVVCLAGLAAGTAFGQDRATKVRDDRKTVEADGSWIYNNLAQGINLAKKTAKPLLVVIRCIP